MFKIYSISFILLFLFGSSNLFSQDKKKSKFWNEVLNGTVDSSANDYFSKKQIRYEDYVYENNIRTVELRNESFELSDPIMLLGSDEKLKLSFDDLDGGYVNYAYTFIHCNSSCLPYDLMSVELLCSFKTNTMNELRYNSE